MWGLCLSVGVGGGGIIAGYIIQDLGEQVPCDAVRNTTLILL